MGAVDINTKNGYQAIIGSHFCFNQRDQMKLYKNKGIKITCPNCGKFLAKADKRDSRTHKLACRKCWKWIWFVPASETTEIKDIPPRASGSGMRFY